MGHGQGGDSPESGNPGVRGWGPRTVGLLVKPRPSNRLEPPAFPAEQPLSPPQVAAAVASLRGRETYKSDARPRRGRPRPSTNSPAPAGPAPGRSSAPSPALARPCRIRSRPQTQLLPFVGAGSVPVRAARLRSGGAAGRGRAVAAGERPMSAAGGGGAARCAPLWLRRVGRCGKSAACGPGASVAPPCRPWPPPPFGRAQRERSRKFDVTNCALREPRRWTGQRGEARPSRRPVDGDWEVDSRAAFPAWTGRRKPPTFPGNGEAR